MRSASPKSPGRPGWAARRSTSISRTRPPPWPRWLEPMHDALFAANTILADTTRPPRMPIHDTIEAVVADRRGSPLSDAGHVGGPRIQRDVRDLWDGARESFVPTVSTVIGAERTAGARPRRRRPGGAGEPADGVQRSTAGTVHPGWAALATTTTGGRRGDVDGLDLRKSAVTAAGVDPQVHSEQACRGDRRHGLSHILGIEVDSVRTAPIGTGQTGATYRVTGYLPRRRRPPGHVRGQAALTGRHRA